jgi:hypothetical protein
MRVLMLAAVLGAHDSAARGQCVGDCQGAGSISIADLILGVNIALGLQPPSACPAFQNAQGQVDIAQLVKGVGNALGGCPSEATPTATSTGPQPPTSTPTVVVPTATASVTAPATATRTSASTATSTPTEESTSTATVTPLSTATATESPTPSPTPTVTATASATETATPTRTPTETVVPVGALVSGHVPIISAGLGSLQSLVAAFVAQASKIGGAPPAALPRGVVLNACSVGGTSVPTCMEMGSGSDKSIHLELDADHCTVAGAGTGSVRFNGKITLDSAASNVSSCAPLAFSSAMFQVGDLEAPGGTVPLEVVFSDALMEPTLTVSAGMSGVMSIGAPPPPKCLVGTMTLTLEGTITALLGNSTGSPSLDMSFFDSGVTVDMITYNDDCVPLSYRLKVNGGVSFSVTEPAPALVASVGGEIIPFFTTFTNLFLTQDVASGSVTTKISGQMSSDCFGGIVQLATLDSLVVDAGDLCPNAGQLSLTSSAGPATLTYDGSQVTVVQGGDQTVFPTCLAPELVTCIPQ